MNTDNKAPERSSSPSPSRGRRRLAAGAAIASVAIVAFMLVGGCSQSLFTQDKFAERPRATAADIARVHDPDALRADLDEIVALHERACPNPYLRASKESIRVLADRLKASIDRPMTRREFLPLVMELQAAYASDHISQPVPEEDLDAAFARGERLLPFRAEPRDGELVVIAVSEGEPGIEPGDRIVRIGDVRAADHVARLRTLVPAETERSRDASHLARAFRSLSWAAGITLPTTVEVIRRDGSTHSVEVAGVGATARKDERLLADGAMQPLADSLVREVLVDSPPFRCVLLALPSDKSPAAPNAPIAYIDFPTMNTDLAAQWSGFLDEAITAVNARGCAGIIVDIRRNGGGDSQLGDMLLARLTDRAHRSASLLIWRRSAESDAMFACGVKPMWRWLIPIALPFFLPKYTELEYGQNWTYEIEPGAEPMVEPSFRGPTALLIGLGTYSSAMLLADAVRTYDLMRTVGQPTGGVPNALGEIGFTQLPNSRFVVYHCGKEFRRASGDASDLGPVVPHIEVEPVPGGDATLERAIEEIRRSNGPA